MSSCRVFPARRNLPSEAFFRSSIFFTPSNLSGYTERMSRALDQLVQLKGQFGRAPAQRAAVLLERLERTPLQDPAGLIRLHETVLFLRAYPQSSRVLRLADEILFSFGERLRGVNLEPFEDPEISG